MHCDPLDNCNDNYANPVPFPRRENGTYVYDLIFLTVTLQFPVVYVK